MKTDKKIVGFVHIGDWKYTIEGEVAKDDILDAVLTARIESQSESREAWELLALLFEELANIARSEVKERYDIEVE